MIRRFCLAAIFTASVISPGASASETTSPIHHAINAQLDPRTARLDVTDTVTVSGRTEMRFQLASWLDVERLLVDGQAIEGTDGGGTWRVALPDTRQHRVTLHMRGALPPFEGDGTGHGSWPASAGPEGGYLPGHVAWIPTTDDDWIAYRLQIEVPADYRAVATGRLVTDVASETTNRAVFEAAYPAEPPSLFVGPYEVRERREGGIRIRTYFHSDLSGLAEDYLRDAARYLVRFSEKIGPYPFQDFHIVSAPIPVGLGFPNLTYIGRTVLPLPFIRGRSLAHEIVHNWWGNGVAVDYATGNWSEGLTTYMADYALEWEKGAEPAREMRLGWLRDYAALPAERDTPVTAFTGKRHDADQVVGYNKVAFIFHMLSQELSEPTFTQGLRLFWQRQRFRIAGWVDLRQAFEEASGRDLAWFFRQWLERTGAPRLSLGGAETSKQGAGYRLALTVRQEPPSYQLTIPITIETRTGSERHQIVLRGVESTEIFDLGAEPLAVHLDPDHDLFRRLLPAEAPPILRDVTLAPDAVAVIAAERGAAERAARQLAEALLDAPLKIGSADPTGREAAPLLIIGITSRVNAWLARAGLGPAPEVLAGRGTARAWTARRGNGVPLLVVAADSVEALEALLRPLPHYRGKSYLVFDGRRAVDTGTWRVSDGPLSRRFVR